MIKLSLAGMAFATMLLVGAAHAADVSDIRMMNETKISLSDAIAAAEKSQNGRAIDASLDDDSFKPTYEVSVVVDNRVFDVQVDGVSGEVLGAREDLDD